MLHLQLSQNIGNVARVLQYIPVGYLTPSSLYLPLHHAYVALPFSAHW